MSTGHSIMPLILNEIGGFIIAMLIQIIPLALILLI